MNKDLLNQAARAFEDFTSQLDDVGKQGLANFAESISATMLHTHLANDNVSQAEQIIDSLNPQALYDEELISPIYEYYTRRGRHDRAFDFLLKTKEFFAKTEIPIPPSIQHLIENSQTEHVVGAIKLSFTNLLGLQPKNVPRITPDVINNKRNLREFILHEIVCACNVMKDKIQGVGQIIHENRFNDLVLAVLRLRLPVWGWNISDQPRRGASGMGLDAGLVDLLIQAGGNDVALIEALILRGGNYPVTKKHVLKCFSYSKNLEQYYVLVYFNGKEKNFDAAWANYCKNVGKIPFAPQHGYDATLGFQDLSGKFDNVKAFRIAKTTHGDGVEMYHIMMSIPPEQTTKKATTGNKKQTNKAAKPANKKIKSAAKKKPQQRRMKK